MRMKTEQMRQEEKHKRQLKALRDRNEATVKELEQLQVISYFVLLKYLLSIFCASLFPMIVFVLFYVVSIKFFFLYI